MEKTFKWRNAQQGPASSRKPTKTDATGGLISLINQTELPEQLQVKVPSLAKVIDQLDPTKP